jgi:hypothetical protein
MCCAIFNNCRRIAIAVLWTGCYLLTSASVHGQDGQETPKNDAVQKTDQQTKQVDEKPVPPFIVTVAEGGIEFSVTGKWKKVPHGGILEAEIKIPGESEKDDAGRLTIMGAGGTIEANITRWEGQFLTDDGKQPTAKTEIKEIAGQKVHLVDLEGTYLDTPGGPFAGGPTVKRADYRMLGAIIQTKKFGNYFVKLYGPKKMIDEHAKHFKSMIESLKVKSE